MLRGNKRKHDDLQNDVSASNKYAKKQKTVNSLATHSPHTGEAQVTRSREQRDRKATRSTSEELERLRCKQNLNTAARRAARLDPDRRRDEQQRDTAARRIARQDIRRRLAEQQHDTTSRRKARENPQRRAAEQERDTGSRKAARSDPKIRSQENARQNERQNIMNAKRRSSWEYLYSSFREKVREGPTDICCCCGGLWFPSILNRLSHQLLRDKGHDEVFIESVLAISQYDIYRACGTCYNAIRSGRVPKLALSNGFGFPELPHWLEGLTSLEERLVALRLPFMQIRVVGAGRQYSLHGTVVNVPNSFDKGVGALPRRTSDTDTVEVMLMRKMAYKHAYQHEVIRPKKVLQAAQYLLSRELYKDIYLCQDWNAETGETNQSCCTNFGDAEFGGSDQDRVPHHGEPEEHADSVEEDSFTSPENETMILEDNESLLNTVVKIAPGEGNIPISVLFDTDAEVLSFPSIYAGERRKFMDGLKVSYTDIAKSEARMYDRRAARPCKLLYSCRLSQIQQLSNSISLCLRKRRYPITVGDVTNKVTIDNLIQHDEGYKCLKNIRGSPAYWELQQKNVFAMIRQLGLPTFFITFSAAETRWPELLSTLKYLHDQSRIEMEEASEMEFQEKSKLIQGDPVTCARTFDFRLRNLIHTILKQPGGAFNPNNVTDYYQRIEFQHRGSPHSHGLYWIANAPRYNPRTEEDCISFVDKYITCERCPNDLLLKKLVVYQLHKHSYTCQRRRGKSTSCRFGFPKPPLDRTVVIHPLSATEDRTIPSTHFDRIMVKLKDCGRDFETVIPFSQFLSELGLSRSEYFNAIRYSIKQPTILLKRATDAAFINPYNPNILLAWRANMDIQFILDPYACARYCVSYINKSDRGISKLLNEVRNQVREGNVPLRDSLKRYANTFLNSSELSAQEAAYLVLGLPLTSSSRSCVFINTSHPDQRVFLVKPQEELDRLPQDSSDIIQEGLLDYYVTRPTEFEECTLAEYAACYSRIRGKLQKRHTPKIIRYRRYNEDQDALNYFREQLMLFLPWRNEQEELIDQDVRTRYNNNLEQISTVRNTLNASIEFEELADLIVGTDNSTMDDHLIPYPGLAEDDLNVDVIPSDTSGRRQASQLNVEYTKPINRLPEDKYLKLVRSLNEKQRRYLLHLVHQMKTSKDPFYEFVYGGAGVGKSHLIITIVQTLIRYYSRDPGPVGDHTVLVCAPTGKAAFNVHGLTMHCAFRLPPNQYNGNLARLEDGTCNTIHSRLCNLKLIIIDEISMASVTQLYQIDTRLKQIFGSNHAFGGIPITVVGDFRQIRPVMGQFVFETIRNNAFTEIAGNTLWQLFHMYELTEIMRQQRDKLYAQALNNMGDGCMTSADVSLLRSREVSALNDPPKEAIRLFRRNVDCEAYNQQIQLSMDTEGAVSVAHDTVEGAATQIQKEKLLHHIRSLPTGDTDGMPYSVYLKVDTSYMVSTNVDVSDGLFNGATGVLKHIEYSKDTSRLPTIAYIEFPDLSVGSDARVKYNLHQQRNNIDTTLVPVTILKKQLNKIGWQQNLRVVRRQIPVIAANAITINKAQGSSIPIVVLDLTRKLPRDLLYVGCSRTFSLDGLFLTGKFQPPGPPPQSVLDEMARLRACPLNLSLRFLQDVEPTQHKLIFHNVQALRKHIEDITPDDCYMAADIIALVETWTVPMDSFDFPNHFCAQRIDSTSKRRSSIGSILLVRKNFKEHLTETDYFVKSTSGGFIEIIMATYHFVRLIVVYRHPTSNLREFLQILKVELRKLRGCRILLVGDVNVDLNTSERGSRRLKLLLSNHDLQLALPQGDASTDSSTQIDVCASNIPGIDAWFFESLFSYHKPICVTWQKEPW